MTTPTTVMIRLEDLRTLLHQANPTYTAQQIERALAAYTGQPDAPKPAKKAIKPVAPARTALQHAQTLSLVSAALRPSLNRNAPSTRWVINFTFGQWADASSFTQAWAAKIGINFHIQRADNNFSVSLPLVAPPANAKTVAISVARHGQAGLQALTNALADLNV